MQVTDQMNRTLTIPENIERIVSLVPSQTELLVDLGLGDKVVGVTKFCVHPQGFKSKTTVVGGTKNFHFDRIKQLKPDLIIGNKEENYKEGIEELEKDFTVWMSDITTVSDAVEMIDQIGIITRTDSQTTSLILKIKTELLRLENNDISAKKALYFIWKNPYMVAGGNNYINEMLRLNGFKNLCNTDSYSRYPELTNDEIIALNPEVILLSSEPFPFKEKHIEEFKKLVPAANIKIVDGELYSWYGSRLLTALKSFN